MQIELTEEMQAMIKEIMELTNTGNKLYVSNDQVILDGLYVLRSYRKAEFDKFMAEMQEGIDAADRGEKAPFKEVLARIQNEAEKRRQEKDSEKGSQS